MAEWSWVGASFIPCTGHLKRQLNLPLRDTGIDSLALNLTVAVQAKDYGGAVPLKECLWLKQWMVFVDLVGKCWWVGVAFFVHLLALYTLVVCPCATLGILVSGVLTFMEIELLEQLPPLPCPEANDLSLHGQSRKFILEALGEAAHRSNQRDHAASGILATNE